MIRVRVFEQDDPESKRPIITRIEMQGHAGSGEYGKDLVCAAASVLMINFVNSVENLCGIDLQPEVHSGFADVKVVAEPSVQLLAHSLVTGLGGMVNEHARYMRIEYM